MTSSEGRDHYIHNFESSHGRRSKSGEGSSLLLVNAKNALQGGGGLQFMKGGVFKLFPEAIDVLNFQNF